MKRKVFIDPDGTAPPYVGIIVSMKSGVVFATQCGGLHTLERSCEGIYVPLGGLQMNAEAGPIAIADLTAIFHDGRRCLYGGSARADETLLAPARVDALRSIVATIPYWATTGEAEATARVPLRVDDSRVSDIVEAWVPVVTPDGPGILTWPNCD